MICLSKPKCRMQTNHNSTTNHAEAHTQLGNSTFRCQKIQINCRQSSISRFHSPGHLIRGQYTLSKHALSYYWSLAGRKKSLKVPWKHFKPWYFPRQELSSHTSWFSDADWTGDTNDYVSTNAYVLYLGSNPISWSSKKQQGVARSSTETEYKTVANTASEICWLCSILQELGIRLLVTPVIYCDNIGATYLCTNPVFYSRKKHIALDYYFIRNLIQSGALHVSHVSTHDQLADTLTKPLVRSKFS